MRLRSQHRPSGCALRLVFIEAPMAPGPRDLVVLALSDTAIGDPVVAALKQHNQAGNETDEADNKADSGPVPVTDVHRRSERQCADQQIEVRQAFVDWFRDPHSIAIFASGSSHSP